MAVPLLILAGGRATRLRELSQEIPKFLMPLDGSTRFADVQLTWAYQQGFREILLSIGYLGEQIRRYCGDGSRYGLSIRYSDDGEVLLGTGGALREAFKRDGADKQQLAVVYGDTLLDLPAGQIANECLLNKTHALMAVYENKVAGHVCNADYRTGHVTYSKSHPVPDWKYIDYGFLVLSDKFLNSLPDASPLDLAAPLEATSKMSLLNGYLAKNRFWEIGSPEALEEFRQQFGYVETK